MAIHNIAMANNLLGSVLEMSGASEPALTYLESARTQFDRLGRDGKKSAQRMASACLTEQGECLRDLGRLDEAAAAYEKRIAFAEKLGDLRGATLGKAQLGTVRYHQKQYANALTTYESAIQSFESLGEPVNVAAYLHQMGSVYEDSGNYNAAETAYRKSLGIEVQQNNKNGEATSLLQLGNLFKKLGQLEDAVTFYRQAADIYVELGDMLMEGLDRSNLADTFIKLKRYDDARQEILRAIECKKPFGHTAEPWKTWQILSTIEQAQGNATAAKDARDQAVALYMAFRRSGGGKYEYGAQLCAMVGGAIQRGARSEVIAALGKLGKRSHPLIDVLYQILNGVRDLKVVEGLDYNTEVDVRLLLESIEGNNFLSDFHYEVIKKLKYRRRNKPLLDIFNYNNGDDFQYVIELIGEQIIRLRDNFLIDFNKEFIKKIKMDLHVDELRIYLELLFYYSKTNGMYDEIINYISNYILICIKNQRKTHLGILSFYKSKLNLEKKAYKEVIYNSQDALRFIEHMRCEDIKNKIYKNLVLSYCEIGDSSKSKKYLLKLKQINPKNTNMSELEQKLKTNQQNLKIIDIISI